ncbi:class I adenylate-forming enzyme family protein [Bacteroides intestinalis]|jgi:long-chain acyl-CoA synthetase|uniref:class I adenylate-forming enzyme family protein n=1 Tax=Bacteroides intestinalis TaxID=329854 RepID=UPI000E4912A3|nr:class I adenylate-forming enzyme family protein [Bacteroides intestinalis]RGX85410.1 long-chain fatty acid--CoA ligase [Bacteroides intestinalis]
MTIEERIFETAKLTPQKLAIVAGSVKVSYEELVQKVMLAAAYFKRCGLQHGDRVVISASKKVEFVYSYFGAHMAGLVCVPIDSETNPVRLRRILDCSQPKLIVGELRSKGELNVIPFADVTAEQPVELQFPQLADIADLMFTTGTTGLPKGVALSFLNQKAAVEQIDTFIGNTTDDVELLALPISHSFGLGRLRCVFSKGATLVFLGSFASMKKFYAEMERCHCTGFGMVPSSWSYIQKMSGEKLADYAGQLKYIEIGSAFMSEVDKRKLMSILPNTKICMHYGLTEASRSSFLSFHDDATHLMSIGKPSPGREIAVMNNGEIVAEGTEGEICVKGDHVCSSYWRMSEEDFRQEFYGDYFRTGDWGYKDAEGYIYLKSRIKEIINVGGKKVSPVEVEEVINQIGGCEESACIGVKDDVMGEVVKAFVVGTLTANDDDMIKQYVAARLENYKVPVYIEHIAELPKTVSGKLQRFLLK